MKQSLLIVLFLFFISLPSVGDLFKPGSFTSHDLGHHIPRLMHVDRILREGQIPPRWTGDLNKGYGYPLLLFNYPLPYYIGEIFHIFGFDFIWSTKLVLAVSLIGSIFTSYIFFRELFGKIPGIVGATFYLYAPIRFINIYVSATIGNALAFLFVPLPFYALLRFKREHDFRDVVIGALGMGGLILSHNIMAYMFMPLLLTFFIMCLTTKAKKKYFVYATVTLILGLGLAAFFWLPAVFEKQYIRYAEILPGFYNSHFPTLRNLIYMPWGYGFAWPGDDPSANPGRMSFQLGLVHFLIVTLNLIYLVSLFIKRKKIDQKQVFFISWFFIAVFFILPVSGKIWDKFSFMQYLQMPWRILALATFAAAALAAFIVSKSKCKLPIALFLVLLVMFANRNHWHINQILDVTDAFYARIDGTTTMAGEHLPSWGKQRDKQSPAEIEIIDGLGELKYTKDTSAEILLQANIIKNSTLQVNQYFFPGWKIYIDDKDTSFTYHSKDSDTNGLMRFEIEPGIHKILVSFTRTPVRILGDIISVISIIIISSLLIFSQTLHHLSFRKPKRYSSTS